MRRRRVAVVLQTALFALAAGCRGSADSTATRRDDQAPNALTLAVKPFEARVYGASGVAQLADGRILVAGDDAYNALEIVDVFGSGSSKVFTPREMKRAMRDSRVGLLNDLEALTTDPRGHVYAATSHALTTKGVEKPAREQLVRFDVARDRLTNVLTCDLLKPALVQLDPLFAAAARLEPHEHAGLNIEGIAWDPTTNRLLIGFRSPRRQRDALVVWLQNPDAVFERGEAPSLLAPIGLDLSGEGVRDVTYSPALRAFVIIAGTWRRGKHTATTLWSWSGGADSPVKLPAPDFDDLNPEGIAEVVVHGERAFLIVSDDGNADELYSRGRALTERAVPSRYALLPLRDIPQSR